MASRLSHTLLTLALVGLAATSEVAVSEAGAAETFDRAAAYIVGPGDGLEVTLRDGTYLLTVQYDGVISLPSGKLRVKGLTVARVRQEVQSHLEALGLSSDRLAVRVKEYRSQVVFITGEVLHPGRYFLSGNENVGDILLRAGSFSGRASGEIVVQPAAGGSDVRISLSPDMTVQEQRKALDIPIAAGDVISVTRKPQVSGSP